MVRNVSFGLLIAVIGIVAFVFYRVMASFLLPLFLAALLVVMFRPVHRWSSRRVPGRPKTAALLTTTITMLIVLVPLIWVLFFAIAESRQVVERIDPDGIRNQLVQMRDQWGLDLPAAEQFTDVETATESLQDALRPWNDWKEQAEHLQDTSQEWHQALQRLVTEMSWEWTERTETGDLSTITDPNERNWIQVQVAVNLAKQSLASADFEQAEQTDSDGRKQLDTCQAAYRKAVRAFANFKTTFLGGTLWEILKKYANPSEEELTNYVQTGTEFLRDKLLAFGGTTAAFLGRAFFATAIMVIALYFFLLDGPAMLHALKSLSPLDDEHEEQLIDEFDRISRAVVLATLLAAVAQGILAGIGFYFASLSSVVLLMLLTTIAALIPFVGAAAIWIPACLWLFAFEGRPVAAILLAIYGTTIISMADNVIKPAVLHGQSNIHPLWALLSVLGGVVALGPIGILVGPMVMAFLQTLLQILQREITSMERPTHTYRESDYEWSRHPRLETRFEGQARNEKAGWTWRSR